MSSDTAPSHRAFRGAPGKSPSSSAGRRRSSPALAKTPTPAVVRKNVVTVPSKAAQDCFNARAHARAIAQASFDAKAFFRDSLERSLASLEEDTPDVQDHEPSLADSLTAASLEEDTPDVQELRTKLQEECPGNETPAPKPPEEVWPHPDKHTYAHVDRHVCSPRKRRAAR